MAAPKHPSDVLRHIARELEEAGRSFEADVEVDCSGLFADLPPGEEYAEVNWLLRRMREQGLLTFETQMGSELWALTSSGVAAAREVYLSPSTRQRVRAVWQARLAERRADFSREASSLHGSYLSRGLGASGMWIEEARRLVDKELQARLLVILNIWRAAAIRQGFLMEEGWAAIVREDMGEALHGVDDLFMLWSEPAGTVGRRQRGDWDQWVGAALHRASAEVEAAVLLEENSEGEAHKEGDINIQNIQGPVAVAQAGGHGNRAAGRQATGSIGYRDGIVHLETLIRILEGARDGGMEAAVELLETAHAVAAEARKPAPNRLTLGALLQGLHHAVSTVNAWPGAVEAVRLAAVAMGFPVG